MNQLILVYKCDNWHTHATKFIIGLSDNYVDIKKICKQYAKSKNEKFKKLDYEELIMNNQTQNYFGEGQFMVEEITLNELIK